MKNGQMDLGTSDKTTSRLDTLIVIGLVIFLLGLPFHLVVKKLLPDPLGTYWKEIVLGLMVILWVLRSLRARRLLLTEPSLDVAVLIYLGLLLLRFVLDRSSLVAAWGLYVSVLYLPLFWLVPTALRRNNTEQPEASEEQVTGKQEPRLPVQFTWVTYLFVLLVVVGALIAVGGLAEFVFDVPLWPSDEMVQRQGFPDVYIYGTHIRRVYFTLDSPTTLANTLALLLPLALVLTLISRRSWMRVAAGFATALMGVCIIVTFSRGIWVAMVLALVLMGTLSGFVRRNKKPLAIIGGVLGVVALAWGGVMVARSGRETSSFQGVVELSTPAYRAAPVVEISQELLLEEPDFGQGGLYTWSLNDPFTGQEDVREVLYQHPPESGKQEIIYSIAVPEEGAFRFAIALSPQVWSPRKGDGASFQIFVSADETPRDGQFVFVRYINPKLNPNDRRWRNFMLDLSPWAGQDVNLSLVTDAGPVGDWAFDWAGWADLQVVSAEPDYFLSTQTENAILRHTGSILDWVRDETNRDRLAAWSLALDAWRDAPLWGSGIGSTGVAALRTNPERAFVTESQVLKALVELGLPGLLALAYLWYKIAQVGYRAYRRADNPKVQLLLLGLLTSLLIIFIEGWVYQNLEVKQVNAYFWTLAGTLAFLSTKEV